MIPREQQSRLKFGFGQGPGRPAFGQGCRRFESGDSVDIASGIESLTKSLDRGILLSTANRERPGDEIPPEEMGPAEIRGGGPPGRVVCMPALNVSRVAASLRCLH